MSYEFNNIKKYLFLEPTSYVKQYTYYSLFLINLFGLIFAFDKPVNIKILYGIIIILVIINIWGLYILTNVQRKQKQYILYIGVYCFAISIIFMINFYKVVYLVLGNTSKVAVNFSVCSYIFIFFLEFLLIKRALRKGYYSVDSNKKAKYGGTIILALSITGVFIGNILAKTATENIKLYICSIGVLLLSYIFELGIHNIYKYYLIKKYDMYIR